MLWSSVTKWQGTQLSLAASELKEDAEILSTRASNMRSAGSHLSSKGQTVSALRHRISVCSGHVEELGGTVGSFAMLVQNAAGTVESIRHEVAECNDWLASNPDITISPEGKVSYSGSSSMLSLLNPAALASLSANMFALQFAVNLILKRADQFDRDFAKQLLALRSSIGGGVSRRRLGERPSKEQNALDLAKLSSAVYDPKDQQNDHKIPPGWSAVSDEELRSLGLDPNMFESSRTGFRARLYKNEDGRYVLSYAGTESTSFKDWANNGVGAVSISDQQRQAVILATAVRKGLERNGVPPSDLQLTGHSLGGGLAAAGSLATGCEASTYNAAGTSQKVATYAANARNTNFGETDSFDMGAAQKKVDAYYNDDDLLTHIQKGSPAPDAFGTHHRLATPGSAEEAGRKAVENAQKGGKGWLNLPMDPLTKAAVREKAEFDHRLHEHGIDVAIEELEKQV